MHMRLQLLGLARDPATPPSLRTALVPHARAVFTRLSLGREALAARALPLPDLPYPAAQWGCRDSDAQCGLCAGPCGGSAVVVVVAQEEDSIGGGDGDKEEREEGGGERNEAGVMMARAQAARLQPPPPPPPLPATARGDATEARASVAAAVAAAAAAAGADVARWLPLCPLCTCAFRVGQPGGPQPMGRISLCTDGDALRSGLIG